MSAAAREPLSLDAVDRRLIAASQAGLPFVPRPYHALAEMAGVAPRDAMARIRRMMASGVIRRIGAVPNHYALGYRANGMTVWDVDDDRVDALGSELAGLACVSHCYRRPRRPPRWRYNLFAMVHGRDRAEMEHHVAEVAAVLGPACRAHEVLVSTRILKKTGLRLASEAKTCSG